MDSITGDVLFSAWRRDLEPVGACLQAVPRAQQPQLQVSNYMRCKPNL
jgi:hypothetical protein